MGLRLLVPHEKIHEHAVHDRYDRSRNGMPYAMEHAVDNLMSIVVGVGLNRHPLDPRVG